MRKFGIPLTLALGAALWAAPSFAGDEENSLRFSADDFLDEYNLFLGEGIKAKEKEMDLTLNLDIDRQEKQESGDFIYFKKGPLEDGGAAASLSLTPVGQSQSGFVPRNTNLTGNLESVGAPSGDTLSLSSFTPRYSGADVNFAIGQDKDNPDRKPGIQILLASQVFQRDANVFGSVNNSFVQEALRSQVYDLGLNVGYANFYLGASIRGEEGAFYDGISGYDVGLSYRRPTWSTSILVGEYRPDGNYITAGLNSPYLDERFFAMELGAAYNLAPWVRFVGSFRMYEDTDLLFSSNEKITISRMFYLGTRVNF